MSKQPPKGLIFKPDVEINGIQPQTLRALGVAADIIRGMSLQPVCTSILDGTHSKDSLHYTGFACDLRSPCHETYNLPFEGAYRLAQVITDKIRQALGPDYDVLHHGPVWHFHIEYDPKHGRREPQLS